MEPSGRQLASKLKQDNKLSRLKTLYKKLSFYTGKKKDKEPLAIQTEDNQWIQAPNEIAREMTQHNKQHFSQAKGCSFKSEKIRRRSTSKFTNTR